MATLLEFDQHEGWININGVEYNVNFGTFFNQSDIAESVPAWAKPLAGTVPPPMEQSKQHGP